MKTWKKFWLAATTRCKRIFLICQRKSKTEFVFLRWGPSTPAHSGGNIMWFLLWFSPSAEVWQQKAAQYSWEQKGRKKKGAAFCRDFLTGAPTRGRNKRGIVHSCYLLKARDMKKQLCVWVLTPALRHWALVLVLTDGSRKVKGEAAEQVNGAAAIGRGGREERRTESKSHQEKTVEGGTSKVWPQPS